MPATPAPVPHRTDLVTTLLAGWFTLGLLLDSWAHNNLPGLESFLTPWHGVFYSGFAATALWVLWTVRHALRRGRGAWQAMPPAYGATLLALPVFAVCGAGDWIWHTIFGIEQELKILFSPTHLGLAASMFVIVTTAVRSAWARPDAPGVPTRLGPAMLATALGAVLVLLFLQYGNALAFGEVGVVVALSGREVGVMADLASSVALTGLVLLVPLLTLARRWPLPFGAATVLAGVAGLLSAAVTGFNGLAPIAGVVLAGILIDVLARVLRPAPQRRARWRAFAVLAPLLTWSGFLVGAYAAAGPQAPPPSLELLTGLPVVQALLGLLVAVLAEFTTAPAPAPADADPAGVATATPAATVPR
ncbi:hypothetical protein CLV92_109190 [Kineococcus xinjiangensis]|uniref:Uncharacterized protein n=1 Tax=Kineococcus xinjiangensis TaxID=512762 RepID=A0A2S6II91_9ACTN|nr:hypothetical protein [Kineococcus xinjiangensis]PPK93911.1 hypothetical protein CLV92_109190 [Kineococcus xinjiangensis]